MQSLIDSASWSERIAIGPRRREKKRWCISALRESRIGVRVAGHYENAEKV